MYDIPIPGENVAPYRLPISRLRGRMAPGIFGARRMQATPPYLERVRNLESSSRRDPGGRKMKHSLWFTLALLAACMPAQSQEQKPATAEPAGNAKSCLIVKHKGTVGRRLLWTALIGVPIAPGAKYDHVDALNFQNAKPAYKGKDLQGFQAQGVRVMILEKNYTQENLDSARKSCREPEGPLTQPKQETKPPEQKQETKPSA